MWLGQASNGLHGFFSRLSLTAQSWPHWGVNFPILPSYVIQPIWAAGGEARTSMDLAELDLGAGCLRLPPRQVQQRP